MSLTIAESVDSFTYDAMGRLRSANNADAKVSRDYYAGGALRTETQKIRTYVGTDTLQHVYTLNYGYDLGGRRLWVQHPSNLAPAYASDERPTPEGRRTWYAYNDATGRLETVTDVLGNQFRFFYDLEGRQDSLSAPGGIGTRWTYDTAGRLTKRRQQAASAVVEQPDGTLGTLMHNDVFTYDLRGKITYVDTRGGWASNKYTTLGHLSRSEGRDTAGLENRYHMLETYVQDALANQVRMRRDWSNSSLPKIDTAGYRYTSQSGRLRTADMYNNERGVAYDSTAYDASGNKEYYGRNFGDGAERNRYYYGADQRLRVVDVRMSGDGNVGTFEEFRYDALGRRVLSRTRQEWNCVAAHCDKSVRRFIWDGDQLFYEIRYRGKTGIGPAAMERDTGLVTGKDTIYSGGTIALIYDIPPFYGRVHYTHGRQIDRPLGIVRWDYSQALRGPEVVFPHESWRGQFNSGSFPDGTFHRCTSDATSTYDTKRCLRTSWPAPLMTMFHNPAAGTPPITWMGGQVDGMRDASGQMYMRNRYYDPSTGRFTQEDPIGIAGGLNVYGFAAGDPVTYSDPYGLNPCAFPTFNAQECAKQAALAMAEAGVRWFGVVADAIGGRGLGEAATGVDSETGGSLSTGQRVGIGVVAAVEAGAARGGLRIISRISEHAGLARHASRLSGSAQRSVDHLTGELARGNLNPGIGTRHLFGGVVEARARDGARVYFRQAGETIEILGKSTKSNQSQVIETLRQVYGR